MLKIEYLEGTKTTARTDNFGHMPMNPSICRSLWYSWQRLSLQHTSAGLSAAGDAASPVSPRGAGCSLPTEGLDVATAVLSSDLTQTQLPFAAGCNF